VREGTEQRLFDDSSMLPGPGRRNQKKAEPLARAAKTKRPTSAKAAAPAKDKARKPRRRS
jgi:hypothetical protein